MAFDRDKTLRKAARLVRQGRVEPAIAEYRRVIEEEPYDWRTAETLADLLVRAGQVDTAVAHYKRIAAHLVREQQLAAAAALYQRVLDVQPDDTEALAETARLASSVGLTADGPAGFPAAEIDRRTADAPSGAAAAFQEFHQEVARETVDDLATQHFRLALTYREMGMTDGAVDALEVAARSPRYRFDAAALLGRIWLERGVRSAAVHWLEQAAEAPAATTEAGRAVLYDLACTLESMGETMRALAVFRALHATEAGYRDVSARVERLSRMQPGD